MAPKIQPKLLSSAISNINTFAHFTQIQGGHEKWRRTTIKKQAISTREQALCQLPVCFEFQIRSERRKGYKSCALQMIHRSKVPC